MMKSLIPLFFISFIQSSFELYQQIHNHEELHIFDSFSSFRSHDSTFVYDEIEKCQEETTLQSQEWPVFQIMTKCFERLKNNLMASDSGSRHCSYNASFVSFQSLNSNNELENYPKFSYLDANLLNQYKFNTFQLVIFVEGTNCVTTDESNLKGGASFLIDADLDEEYLVSCSVKDHFNNKYTIHCNVPQQSLPEFSEKRCLHVSIRLMFENFDAYADDSKKRQVNVLKSNIFDREKFCVDASNKHHINSLEYSKRNPSYFTITNTNGAYIRPFSRTTFRNPNPYDGFEWYDKKYGLLHYKISAVQHCLQSINLTIVGESHARYYWVGPEFLNDI